ncbi:hypothetical protein BCR39DRAFT_558133 [Naematelia encephala]|uniref:Uncharacterized protein n=1 Tax=Naematelia encephala TaxID=71784 RepID=A0A1Y2BAW6_9TREE|nr:hypothetical protein BCR39DRAFT_558133 [Naematelia encephala]
MIPSTTPSGPAGNQLSSHNAPSTAVLSHDKDSPNDGGGEANLLPNLTLQIPYAKNYSKAPGMPSSCFSGTCPSSDAQTSAGPNFFLPNNRELPTSSMPGGPVSNGSDSGRCAESEGGEGGGKICLGIQTAIDFVRAAKFDWQTRMQVCQWGDESDQSPSTPSDYQITPASPWAGGGSLTDVTLVDTLTSPTSPTSIRSATSATSSIATLVEPDATTNAASHTSAEDDEVDTDHTRDDAATSATSIYSSDDETGYLASESSSEKLPGPTNRRGGRPDAAQRSTGLDTQSWLHYQYGM